MNDVSAPVSFVICQDSPDAAVIRGKAYEAHKIHVVKNFTTYNFAGPLSVRDDAKLADYDAFRASIFALPLDAFGAEALMTSDPYWQEGAWTAMDVYEAENLRGHWVNKPLSDDPVSEGPTFAALARLADPHAPVAALLEARAEGYFAESGQRVLALSRLAHRQAGGDGGPFGKWDVVFFIAADNLSDAQGFLDASPFAVEGVWEVATAFAIPAYIGNWVEPLYEE